MTRRPLLWITACAVTLGAAAASPAAIGAQEGAGLGTWQLTVENPGGTDGISETKQLLIGGEASGLAAPSEVTVTVARGAALPDACGAPQTFHPMVDEGRYHVQVTVACNGPYRIDVTGGDLLPQTATTDVGVAEKPLPPDPPNTDRDAAGVVTASWTPSPDVDVAGWVLVADGDEMPLPADTLGTDLPAANAGDVLALRAQRWGAGGPGSGVVTSDPSGQTLVIPNTPKDPDDKVTPPPPLTPGTPPPAGGGGTTAPPGSTSPPTTGGPTRGTGSDATLPAGYTEELPYGVPDDAIVPGESPAADSGDGEESASGTSPTGLVRTSEKTSPGLVAPFALALLMITVAAHIAWYLRRSKPTGGGGSAGGGQVTLL